MAISVSAMAGDAEATVKNSFGITNQTSDYDAFSEIFPDPLHPMRRLRDTISMRIKRSSEMTEYTNVKKEYYRIHDEVKNINFSFADHVKRRAKRNTNTFFFQACRLMMQDICSLSCLQQLKPRRILDMCCAPGGFSSALLERYPEAEIDAFSLPEKDGTRLKMMIENDRLHFKYGDVCRLALTGSEYTEAEYDLVVADAAWVNESDPKKRFFDTLALKLAQNLMMLRAIKDQGTFITRVRMIRGSVMDAIPWIVLEEIFDNVILYRPSDEAVGSMWTQSFLYLICDGLKPNRQEMKRTTEFHYLQCIMRDGRLASEFLTDERINTLQNILDKQECIARYMRELIAKRTKDFVMAHQEVITRKQIHVPECINSYSEIFYERR